MAAAELHFANLRGLQGRTREALDGFAKGRAAFEALGEPLNVAVTWYQTGQALESAGQFDAAEDAYRQSLAIRVREADLPGQADTLNQLGLLYAAKDRLEDSVVFLRQAAEIYTRSEDRLKEGIARSNLAKRLLELRRYDEARQELQRAIACKRDYGHAGQPWDTWAILANLEVAIEQPDAAHEARQQAIATYLAYRSDGGISQSDLMQFYPAVAQAISQNQQAELTRHLNKSFGPDAAPRHTAVVRSLKATLAGERDPTLADNPDIQPIDAAELRLLLEALNQHESTTEPG
jgi:tetratricopeptide (TPR) repeat protein